MPRKHVRTRVRSRNNVIRTKDNTMVRMFSKLQCSTEWTRWDFRTISQRQAVAFTVADMAVELEGLRLATYRAAARADRGLSFAREATLARRLVADRGMRLGSDAVQMLGGHGYTREHPVERWYRDLRAAGMIEGALLV